MDSRSCGDVQLSQSTVSALNSSSQLAKHTRGLFLGPSGNHLFFRHVRKAIQTYEKKRRPKLTPQHFDDESVFQYSGRHSRLRALVRSAPAEPCEAIEPDEEQHRCKSVPLPLTERIDVHVRSKSRMQDNVSSSSSPDSPKINGCSSARAPGRFGKFGNPKHEKRQIGKEAISEPISKRESNELCSLAKSCLRYHSDHHKPDSDKLSTPMAWMLQQHGSEKVSARLAGTLTWDKKHGEDGPQHDTLSWMHERKPEHGDHNMEDDIDNDKRNLTHFQAHDLAQRFNLPPGVVTDAWRKFKTYDRDNQGWLTPSEFQLLLRSVLRDRYPHVRDIPRTLFNRSVREKASEVSFSEFLLWISEHAFSESILLTDEQQSLRRKARELGVSVPALENIKLLFDTHDADASGNLDYPEFCTLLTKLLGTQTLDALPETRTKCFWREIEGHADGAVDFNAVLTWYLRYFDVSGMLKGNSPVEEYYESIRPLPQISGAFASNRATSKEIRIPSKVI